jgi:circadian clock protein KaiC
VLISGLAGTGKSTFAASFADAICARGERCLYFAFEESPSQIVRNMRSAGIDLQRHLDADLLRFEAARPTLHGLEMHLARMNRDIEEFQPSAVIVDPISAFRGVESEIHATLLRLVDVCKGRGITALLTSLSLASDHVTESDRGVSSLMDTWISLTDVEANGERNRVLYVLKARGMKHSNQLREYLLTDAGIQLIEPYIGPSGVLTGAARLAQEGAEQAEEVVRQQAQAQRTRSVARKRRAIERQIANLQAELEAEGEDADLGMTQDNERQDLSQSNRHAMAAKRGASQ